MVIGMVNCCETPGESGDGKWQLHPTLAADCHVLGRMGDSHLLLHRNASLHWFILVPETDALDLVDLPAEACHALMDNAAEIGEVLKHALGYPRVNIGALGLLVPQLHLHVIGRRESDPCWPGPVWGALPPGAEYSDSALVELNGLLGPRFRRGDGGALGLQ